MYEVVQASGGKVSPRSQVMELIGCLLPSSLYHVSVLI